MLPRVVADITSTVPRASEWLAGANPSWSKTSNATAGVAQAIPGMRDRTADLFLRVSNKAKATAATIQIQALVAVTAASAARMAAIFIRLRTAANPAPARRVVNKGSATADPDVKRK